MASALGVLTLHLFGLLEVHIDGALLPGLHLREGERLLAYLTLRQGEAVSYRQLAQRFWPSEARYNDDYDGGDYPCTRQAIHALRRAMGDHAWRLAGVGKGIVRLDLTGADVDILRFEQLAAQEDEESHRQAIALYRGPLLDGWNEGWVQEARARLQRAYDRLAATERKTMPQIDESALVEADGGAVPLDSPFYVERETDREFQKAIARQDSIVLVKGARQIGKTSLLARGLQQARQAGGRVLLTDFQSLSLETLASPETLYRTLAQEMADQLDLDVDPEAHWNAKRSANRNLERFLCDVVLAGNDVTLVWGLDEVDRLFACPFGSEVFGLFRSWHNRRALDPEGPWSRLTLAMAYATEAHLFIQDINQSPFNVGTRLALDDFTHLQVAKLNHRYGSPLSDPAAVQRFFALLHGHPYLTRRGLSEIRTKNLTIDAIEAQADRSDGLFGDHLRRLLAAVTSTPELTEIVRALANGQPCATEEVFYRLRSAGLLTGTSREQSEWRCPIYASYLKRNLH